MHSHGGHDNWLCKIRKRMETGARSGRVRGRDGCEVGTGAGSGRKGEADDLEETLASRFNKHRVMSGRKKIAAHRRGDAPMGRHITSELRHSDVDFMRAKPVTRCRM